MATFILKWNPAISSVKMADFLHFYKDEFPFGIFNWSIWDYKKAHEDDECYLLRVGEGRTGIVLAGTFYSDPYRAEDWSGQGRETYYSDIDVDSVFHPEVDPIITTEQLEEAIPDFDWRGGHSGVRLTGPQQTKLRKLFRAYKNANPEIFERIESAKKRIVQPYAIASIEGGELWNTVIDDVEGNDRYTPEAVKECSNVSFSVDYAQREARLAVRFRNGKILHLICRKLRAVHTYLEFNDLESDNFKLSKPWSDETYMLRSNNIQVNCDEIVFEKVTE